MEAADTVEAVVAFTAAGVADFIAAEVGPAAVDSREADDPSVRPARRAEAALVLRRRVLRDGQAAIPLGLRLTRLTTSGRPPEVSLAALTQRVMASGMPSVRAQV
jgi:hypothetical protein